MARVSVLLLIVSLFLQGCMDVATTGAQMVYNRQTIKKNLTDQYISMQAYQALNHKPNQFKDAHISISTLNREVLLAGQAPEHWQKRQAEYLVRKIPEVKEVYNLITVNTPSSSLIRLSDAWLTGKVKAKLMASDEVDATQIKVVTENGTVYLMGILPPEQAVIAANLASQTDGVQRVVKIFSYMRITKS